MRLTEEETGLPGKKSKKDPDKAADFVLKDDDFLAAFDGENCLGEATFDKIKEYANLSEERREAYEAYLSNWDEGTLEDFEERDEGKYNCPEDFAEYPERSPDGTGESP